MVGNEEIELTDDVIEAMLNLMEAHSSQCYANIVYLTPAEITLYTANLRLYIRKCFFLHERNITKITTTATDMSDTDKNISEDMIRNRNKYTGRKVKEIFPKEQRC